jgi:hypothetical protein
MPGWRRAARQAAAADEWQNDWRAQMLKSWRILQKLGDKPKEQFYHLLGMLLPRSENVQPRVKDRDDWSDVSVNDLLDDRSFELLSNALVDTCRYTLDVERWRSETHGKNHPLTTCRRQRG